MTDAELVRRMTDMYLKAYQDAVKEYERLWNLIDDVSTGKKKPPSFYDTPEKIAKWKQGFIRSQFRQENVVANIAKKLAEVGVDVRPVIKSYIHDVYRYNRELAIGGIKRAVNINFDQYDKRQIDILLDDEQPVFSKIAYRNLGKNGIIVDRLQREFAAGIINGDDKTKMLKRVQKVTGQSRYQAWRVAQTERTRVSSQARNRVINEAAAQGVIVLKEWSTRMRNSREAHISLDGQRVASGEVFHVNPENDVISRSKKNGVRLGTGYDIAYPGDPSAPARAVCNCFCVLIPRVEKKPDKPIEQGGTAEQIEVKPEDITAKRGEDVTLEQKPVTATQTQDNGFVPAKTRAEAEKFAKKYFADSIDYSGISVYNANTINETLYGLIQKYPIKRLDYIAQKAIGAVARANYNMLEINGKKLGKVLDGEEKDFNAGQESDKYVLNTLKQKWDGKPKIPFDVQNKINKLENKLKYKRWGVHSSYENHVKVVITHEYGHILSDQYFGMLNEKRANPNYGNNWKLRDMNQKWQSARQTAMTNGDIYSLSKYGSKNTGEFFAESFAAYEMGEKLPSYVEDLMKEVLSNGIM